MARSLTRTRATVTPLIDVRLEDILDRQHLPPLGTRVFPLSYTPYR